MMSIISRGFLNKTVLSNANMLKNFRLIGIKIRPVQQPSGPKSYDEINMEMKRPMSPSLFIYKPEMTSMLSITHRITGCALAFYASGLGISALLLPNDVSHYISILENLPPNSLVLYGLKFCISFPLVYHFLTGARHLIWDTGRLLDIKQVYSSGYVIIGATSILTIWLTML